MQAMTLKGDRRTGLGKRPSRKLRETGSLPVIIYGHGETPEAITLSRHDVEVALSHGARTLAVAVGGETRQYLIKEVQYDYLGHAPIHLDLARVDLHERVRVKVGIELRGVPKGVSEGGVLDQYLADIEIECTVIDIPETIHPLVSHLTLGQSLLVKDIPLPPGVVAVTNGEDRVATVRALAEAPTTEAPVEGEVVAEPELITRGKKEEAPEEEA